MKKLILPTLILFTSFVFAQKDNFNKFSLETAFGLSYPIAPSSFAKPIFEGVGVSEFAGPKHFDIGARYMVSALYGFKLSYAYDRFQYDGSSLASSFYRFGLEAVFNVSELFDIRFTRRGTFQIQLHGGLGGTFASSKTDTSVDQIGNIMLGVRPIFKLTKGLALTTDLSYILNFKQHYDYAGQSFAFYQGNREGLTGGFLNFSVGLNFNLGDRRVHADFY
ncbi:hypothetical protein N9936_00430 [bacterium]|nr:hypothetical protein [bacterium]